MNPRDCLGSFEQLVLYAILRLGSDAYGVPIHQEIQTCSGRQYSLGAVYTTLQRLEDKGYVSSWTGECTPQRGGRAKKYFRVEAAGSAALRASLGTCIRIGEAVFGGAS